MRTDDIADVKRTLWAAADQIRANSQLTPAEFRGPALGLIFLAYAEHRFEQVRPGLEAKATVRRPVTADDYRAESVLFISEEARLSPGSSTPMAAPCSSASVQTAKWSASTTTTSG